MKSIIQSGEKQKKEWTFIIYYADRFGKLLNARNFYWLHATACPQNTVEATEI